jgi:hypothetical protein
MPRPRRRVLTPIGRTLLWLAAAAAGLWLIGLTAASMLWR